jgi:hypothetical protein
VSPLDGWVTFRQGQFLVHATLGLPPLRALELREAVDRYEAWLVELATRYPDWPLPVDPGMFHFLQATRAEVGHALAWQAFLQGGAGVYLPEELVRRFFKSDLVRECRARAQAGDRLPCIRVGRARPACASRAAAAPAVAPSSSFSSSSTTSPSPSMPIVRHLQGDLPTCAVSACASAIGWAGDVACSDKLAALSDEYLSVPSFTDTMAWLQERCRAMLQPHGWTVQRLRLGSPPRFEALVSALATTDAADGGGGSGPIGAEGGGDGLGGGALDGGDGGGMTVHVILLEDSTSNSEHAVALAGRTDAPLSEHMIFDANRPRAMRFSRASLDACCLEGATFNRVVHGFVLTQRSGRPRKTKRRRR